MRADVVVVGAGPAGLASATRLAEAGRQVLLLAYFEGLSQREVAERLGVPIGTVKARASRGTRRLRDVLAAGDGEFGGGTR